MKNLFKKIIVKILIFESKLVLAKYKPKIVAITGSVGKTSTKDAVFSVVSKFAHVRKSEKSYNSQIGLPLTILGLSNAWNNPFKWMLNVLQGLWLIIIPHKYPKWLVLEVGVGKPGDMAETASWLKTDIVIMTTIPETPVHIEFFTSRKHLVDEKAGLIKTLKPSGTLILNADNETVLGMRERTRNLVLTYGFDADADIRASEDNIFYTDSGEPKGITFRVDEGGKSLPVVMEGVFGRSHIYTALAALACVHVLKWNILEAIDALRTHDTPPGRMKVLAGVGEIVLIDDSYNSSPAAAESALETLGRTDAKRKIAVLGDMLELGKHTEEAHRELGKLAKKNSDIVVVVGPRSKFIAEGATAARLAKKNLFEFANSALAAEFMKDFVEAGDLVLVKGSQGMRMERVMSVLLLDQDNKEKLLVRQDEEWQKRD